jgi:proteasome lid subunit RPN8/RPN11
MVGIVNPLVVPLTILNNIHVHGEASYPEEGAGFLLGHDNGEYREVCKIFPIQNAREDSARHNRYLITPQDLIRAEAEADRNLMTVLGVFHSHPDHPNMPSEFDREWALPWFSYLITSVHQGKETGSRSWRLMEDRQGFIEEDIKVGQPE